MEAIFPQNSPQNLILETSIKHENSEKGRTFSSKIPGHTSVRKYHESPPGDDYGAPFCEDNKRTGLVISFCSNSYHLISLIPPNRLKF